MATEDFVIFDTCTLPEYYNDVQKILSLPREHVVTYDYSAGNIEEQALTILKRLVRSGERRRVLLAYMQALDYKKGDSSPEADPVLPETSFATLTRLAEVIAVRELTNNNKTRYYLDLKLLGYPFDRHQTIANDIVRELRKRNCIPMRIYIAVCPDNASDVLFAQTGTDEHGFSTVVDGLSTVPSQFYRDTFWRIRKITARTKPPIPFLTSKHSNLQPLYRFDAEQTETYLSVRDQSTIFFYLQFHRGREHGPDYRIRKIRVEISPKSAADDAVTSFATRSFGRETVAINVPATSSLSVQDVSYQFETVPHDNDEFKDYPYGPNLKIAVQYRKAPFRSALALALICAASGLFAWAAFSTSVLTGVATAGTVVSMCWRTMAVIIGVLATLYSYYLWSDEISLDRARRS
jgi:hypothetical protein